MGKAQKVVDLVRHALAKEKSAIDRQLLDALPLDRESIYRAWQYGRLYGRQEAISAAVNLPSVFGAADSVAGERA